MTDLREYHREATDVARAVVGGVDEAALGAATPCAGWDLGRLLAHMTGQNHGFAASARGETRDMGIWADRPVGARPAAVFGASADDVTAAFAADGALQRGFWLPEIRAGGAFPAKLAIGFHLVDTVVHAWDVAKSLGVEVEFGPGVLAATLPIALAVPGGAARLTETAAFAPAVPSSGAAPPLDRILAALGRDPGWKPPVADR
jgi:uncharacterized protein (TIGR03086 family)